MCHAADGVEQEEVVGLGDAHAGRRGPRRPGPAGRPADRPGGGRRAQAASDAWGAGKGGSTRTTAVGIGSTGRLPPPRKAGPPRPRRSGPARPGTWRRGPRPGPGARPAACSGTARAGCDRPPGRRRAPAAGWLPGPPGSSCPPARPSSAGRPRRVRWRAREPSRRPHCGPPSSLSPEKRTRSAPAARPSATVGSPATPGGMPAARAPEPMSSIAQSPRAWARAVSSARGTASVKPTIR